MTDCVLVGFYGVGAAFTHNVKEARPRTKSKAKDPRDLVRRATSKTKPLSKRGRKLRYLYRR